MYSNSVIFCSILLWHFLARAKAEAKAKAKARDLVVAVSEARF